VQEKDSAIDNLRSQNDSLNKEVTSLREQLDKSELNFANKNKEWQQVDYEKKAYEINFKQLQEKFRKQAVETDQLKETLRELTNENKMLEKNNKETSLQNTQLNN
jgi:uncharacterized coiled-coil DUF342 family protein